MILKHELAQKITERAAGGIPLQQHKVYGFFDRRIVIRVFVAILAPFQKVARKFSRW